MLEHIRGLYFSGHHLTRDLLGNVAPLTAFAGVLVFFVQPAQVVAGQLFKDYLLSATVWTFVLALIVYLVGGYFVGIVVAFMANFLHRLLSYALWFDHQLSYNYWYRLNQEDIDELSRYADIPTVSALVCQPDNSVSGLRKLAKALLTANFMTGSLDFASSGKIPEEVQRWTSSHLSAVNLCETVTLCRMSNLTMMLSRLATRLRAPKQQSRPSSSQLQGKNSPISWMKKPSFFSTAASTIKMFSTVGSSVLARLAF